MITEQSAIHAKQVWKEVALHPLLSSGPADRRELHRRSTYCCCRSPRPLDYCWTYISLVLYLYTFGLRRCANLTTPSYLAVSGGLAGGMWGKRDQLCCFYHPPWQLLGCRLSWIDCCCCWLWLDLLGSAGYLKNALLRSRLGCYVADFA